MMFQHSRQVLAEGSWLTLRCSKGGVATWLKMLRWKSEWEKMASVSRNWNGNRKDEKLGIG